MNKNEYKEIMSKIQPSDEVVERIMDMTESRKKRTKPFIKAVAVFAAFALIICSGVIVNNFSSSQKTLGVAVAYADKLYRVDGNGKQHTVFYMSVASADDKEELASKKQEAKAVYNEISDEALQLSENGYGAQLTGVGTEDLYADPNKEPTAVLYTVSAGTLLASIDDYTDVKSLTIENESEYGKVWLESSNVYDLLFNLSNNEADESFDYLNSDGDDYFFVEHKHVLTGDELRKSQEEHLFASGLGSKEINKGYWAYWCPSGVLKQTLAENPDFDLTTIKDTITFTFEYNDGHSESASVSITFDKNGQMILS